MLNEKEAQRLLKRVKEEGLLNPGQIKAFESTESELARFGINKSVIEIALDHGAISERQILELSAPAESGTDTMTVMTPGELDTKQGRDRTATLLGRTRKISPDSMSIAFTGELYFTGLDLDSDRGDGKSCAPMTVVNLKDAVSDLRPDEFVGKTLGGCELREFVSHGAMGLVFKAHHTTLNKIVAVKILSPRLFHDDEQVSQFFREAQAAASTEHQNIVGIYDLGLEDDLYFIVMQFIEGGSVEDMLKRGEQVTYQQAARIALETAHGLAAAHSRGIVHRDIKPANLLLTETGGIRIADFGLAFEQQSTEVGEVRKVMGTPSYMAPEQIAGRSVDQRADLYALGVTLYYLSTGRKPFIGENAQEVVRKHLVERPPQPREVDPSIPEDLERIIERLMAKEPDNRYSNARELIVDLEEFLHGGEPQAVLAMEDFMSRMEEISRGVGAESTRRGTISRFTLGALAGAMVMLLFALGLPTPWVAETPGVPVLSGALEDAEQRYQAAETLARRFPTRIDLIRQEVAALEENTPYPYPQLAERMLEDRIRIYEIMKKEEAEPKIRAAADLLPDAAATLGALSKIDPALLVGSIAAEAEDLRERCRVTLLEKGEVLVPGGTFLFGPEREERELPAFLIDETEVSNRDYSRFVAATGHPAPPRWQDGEVPAGKDDLPVVGVSYLDACAYAEWVGKRLPTSEEWEKAARGTDGRLYPWGDRFDASYVTGRGAVALVPVDAHADHASPFGCRNMAGNAFEWTCTPAPDGAADRMVVRGGCLKSYKSNLRVTAVWAESHDDRDPAHAIGFRCVRDLP